MLLNLKWNEIISKQNYLVGCKDERELYMGAKCIATKFKSLKNKIEADQRYTKNFPCQSDILINFCD